MGQLLNVDPATLHLPPSSAQGADPAKLHRQIAKHGKSVAAMPPLIVYRAADGVFVIYDGVTRATRVAKLLPGQTVAVEVAGDLKALVELTQRLETNCHDQSHTP